MIVVALRQAMATYAGRHDSKYTYPTLAKSSVALCQFAALTPGYERLYKPLSLSTLQSIARSPFHNTSRRRLNSICRLLGVTAYELIRDLDDATAVTLTDADGSKAVGLASRAPANNSAHDTGANDMTKTLDPVTRSIIHVIESNGFQVTTEQINGKWRVTASTGKTAHSLEGTDPFRVTCTVAEQCGIDLADG